MSQSKPSLWQIFTATFTLSAFTFGGGYVIVTLMKERFVDRFQWIEEDEMLDLVALSQSAPGAMAINASIIVFDRVRENLRTARKEPFEVIGEKSIWQTMGRTINTTLTTLFTIGMVYILGVPSLKQFTLPLIVGILAGGWSSVMLSTGLWGFFRKKFRRRRKI